MKRILAIAAVASILAACGGQAHAQNPTKLVYSAQTVQGLVTFSIRDARKIQVVSGFVNLTYANGTTYNQYLQDTGGVFNKIKNDHPEYLTQGVDTLYIADKAIIVPCQSGQTLFAWQGVSTEYVNDGCQLAAQSASKSN